MTLQVPITATDAELTFGSNLLRIFPTGTALPLDVTPDAYDLLLTWPVEMDTDGVTPRKLTATVFGTNPCLGDCPHGPPPPYLPNVVGVPDEGQAATLAVNRGGVTYGQTEVHFAPSGQSLLSPGPVLIIAGLQTSLDAISATVAAWLGITDATVQIQVQVFNVFDPSQAATPPSPTPHPLHDTAIAIPVVPWTGDGGPL